MKFWRPLSFCTVTGPQISEFMQTATGVLYLFFFLLGAKSKQGAERQGWIRKVICYIPTASQEQAFGTRCSLHIKTYNPLY